MGRGHEMHFLQFPKMTSVAMTNGRVNPPLAWLLFQRSWPSCLVVSSCIHHYNKQPIVQVFSVSYFKSVSSWKAQIVIPKDILKHKSGQNFSIIWSVLWCVASVKFLSKSPFSMFFKSLAQRSVLNQLTSRINGSYPAARNAFNQLCQDITINSVFRKTNYAIQQLKGLWQDWS